MEFHQEVPTQTRPPPVPPADHDKPPATENIPQPKLMEPFKPTEESYIEKPFIPPKPIPHSPKISPSSIPNPSPSVTTTKHVEPGYPSYGGYLYSIPGYSAFQPISYPGMMQPNQAPMPINKDYKDIQKPTKEFVPFPPKPKDLVEDKEDIKNNEGHKIDLTKTDGEFENKTDKPPAPVVTITEGSKNLNESQMSITSLAQGSGATVTIPSQTSNKDITKKKIPERYSLKTSIPISKIDMKCVTTPTEPVFQNSLSSKGPSAFTSTVPKPENQTRVEIQSNIVIKTGLKEAENKNENTQVSPQTTNINTLINAVETVTKSDNTFKKPEPKQEVINEIKDPPPNFQTLSTSPPKPLFNPLNVETSKPFPNKQSDGYNEQKNQILFIQNTKNSSNPKMLLTIQQQNPQVLLQRNNFESKNLLAPSRLSKRSKEDPENGASSKVVALKRLHQENCDENDFENLITENQIYGNKIVVKEKTQGTLQEQDMKNKKYEKSETKNVVLQPNFLYLSNVQFPNLMMIKNNNNNLQHIENYKNGVTDKLTNEASTMTNDLKINTNHMKTQNHTKEFSVLKSSNMNNKKNNDLVFQNHQKVIMNPQILYQVPMIVDADNKLNQQFINRDYPKFISQNKKEFDKQNDKLYIACPYQMDSKLQPKIVITNIRPKIAKIEEISSLDVYEKKRRIRRLKYLTNRETKEKVEVKRSHEKVDSGKNIITPSKMKAEICKEFAKSKLILDDGDSESDSDYNDDLNEYNNIIKEYGVKTDDRVNKAEFLANFKLGTIEVYKDKELDRQERTIRRDSIACAYIAAGRLDRLTDDVTDVTKPTEPIEQTNKDLEINMSVKMDTSCEENGISKQKKQYFLSQLQLLQVSEPFKKGYEKVWNEVMKERKRRNGFVEERKPAQKLEENLDPNGQLQLLTEIKKCVNDNNNLIKKRLDSSEESNEGDSIHILAEKNFSELSRLSKLADSSVKLITGQNTRRRDLNPGFDSENIQREFRKIPQAIQNVPQINIPNISAIISLKSSQNSPLVTMTSQATSMDEPQNSAAGLKEMFDKSSKGKDFSCQVEDSLPWPGVEAIMKSFREYDAARKREINELHRRNTLLRVEGAHITRAASHHSERARALLAERQNLANEENKVTLSLQRLCTAVEVVRNAL